LKKNNLLYLVFLFILIFSTFIRLGYAPVNVNWTVSADPDSLTLTLGSSGQSTVSVSNTGGIQITVTLSTSSIGGVSTSFNPEELTVPIGETRQSTLTISVGDSATPGVYELVIYANHDPISRNTTITLTILSGGYENIPVGGYIVTHSLFKIIIPLEISLTIIMIMLAVIYHRKSHHK